MPHLIGGELMERQTLASTFSGVLESQLSVLSPPAIIIHPFALHKLHEVRTAAAVKRRLHNDNELTKLSQSIYPVLKPSSAIFHDMPSASSHQLALS